MRRFTVGFVVAAIVVSTVYSLQPGRPAREPALAALDTLRDFPWLEDSYRFEGANPEDKGPDASRINHFSQALARRGTKALLILRSRRIVHEWYAPFHGSRATYRTASLAKALVGSMALLVAMEDGLIGLDDPAWRYIPGWREDPLRSAITIRDLANHSSGIEHAGENSNPGPHAKDWKEEYWRNHAKRFHIALYVAPVIFRPGTRTSYSGPGYAALSYALTASLRNSPVCDLEELLRTRIMRPLGVPDHHWTISYGSRFHRDGLTLYLFEGGGRYTARAAAQVGQLIVERGIWKGQKILIPRLIDSLARGDLGAPLLRPEREPVSAIGWWSNAGRMWPHLPEDTLVGAGDGHQLVVIIPSHRLVFVRQGKSLGGPPSGYWQVVDRQILRPLAEILRTTV